MRPTQEYDASRRKFISSIVPFCTTACLIKGNNIPFLQTAGKVNDQSTHKFDRKLDQEFTYRRLFSVRYHEFIQFSKALKKEWGAEKLISFLKKNTEHRMFQYGQNQAEKFGDNSFSTYVKQFRPPAYQNLMTHEITEDTDTTFQMKVTECIWAKTFLEAGSGDIGYAHVCYGDYSWTRGFNPKITIERDRTLMQGHDYCNHRYILSD